jgi:hypothetical protein
VILKFPDTAARADFLSRMESAAPAANIRLKPSFAQPTVVIVRALGGLNDQRLRSALMPHLKGDVKIFDDVQFRAMA